MKVYLFRHLQVLFDTLGRMIRSPLPNLIAIMVLAIAITLPLLLFTFADSLDVAGKQWQGKPTISLFLKKESGDVDSMSLQLAERLLTQNEVIQDIQYISPSEALLEFKQSSEYLGMLDGLADNPLPPLLIVHPKDGVQEAMMEQLASSLSNVPEVDSISYDGEWVKRLDALIQVAKQVLLVLAVLMGLGMALIIGNTARIEILGRKDEISILDQIGATRAFIRRPFLYFGVMQGVSGALLALTITNILNERVNPTQFKVKLAS